MSCELQRVGVARWKILVGLGLTLGLEMKTNNAKDRTCNQIPRA
jgi:hypothetical protein